MDLFFDASSSAEYNTTFLLEDSRCLNVEFLDTRRLYTMASHSYALERLGPDTCLELFEPLANRSSWDDYERRSWLFLDVAPPCMP